MFYLTTHSTHFIYGYMASDIWLRTILIVKKETRCRHIGYSYRLTARVLLYAPSHRQDNTYHGLCYTSRGALAGMRNSSMGPPRQWAVPVGIELLWTPRHPPPLAFGGPLGFSLVSLMIMRHWVHHLRYAYLIAKELGVAQWCQCPTGAWSVMLKLIPVNDRSMPK